MKAPAPNSLPDEEWHFERVPDKEVWACLIWEYARSAPRLRKLLPDYNSPSDVRAKLDGVAGASAPAALKLLHRMLQESAQRKKNAVSISAPRSSQSLPPSQANTRSKALAIAIIVELIPHHDDHQKFALDIASELNPDDVLALANDLGQANIARVERTKILRCYRKKISQTRLPSPFPDTPWQLLSQADREVMLPMLFGQQVSVNVELSRELMDNAPDSLNPMRLAELLAQCAPAEPTFEEVADRDCPRHSLSAGRGLEDVTDEAIALDAAAMIHKLRDAPSAQQGFGAVLFRYNWKVSDEDLVGIFKRWLKCRPAQFMSYAKGKNKSSRGPNGIELKVTRAGKDVIITPRRALSNLGAWRKLEPYGDAAGHLEKFLADYHGTAKGSKYGSLKSDASTRKAETERIFRDHFLGSFKR